MLFGITRLLKKHLNIFKKVQNLIIVIKTDMLKQEERITKKGSNEKFTLPYYYIKI